jgi:hypothetical protein
LRLTRQWSWRVSIRHRCLLRLNRYVRRLFTRSVHSL